MALLPNRINDDELKVRIAISVPIVEMEDQLKDKCFEFRAFLIHKYGNIKLYTCMLTIISLFCNMLHKKNIRPLK